MYDGQNKKLYLTCKDIEQSPSESGIKESSLDGTTFSNKERIFGEKAEKNFIYCKAKPIIPFKEDRVGGAKDSKQNGKKV